MTFLVVLIAIVGIISCIVFLISFYLQMVHNVKSIVTPITLFIGGIAFLIMGLASEGFEDQSTFIWGGVIATIVGLGWYWKYKADERDGVFERERQQELLQIEREREQAIESQNQTTPWAKKYMTSPCPYCGHYKVRWAKWEDKQMSVAFWGGASSKIGTNYKCEHCGKMWE